ncbi:MAG: HEAT repeat domain-containing protein [Planctomycetota bacterium]|jgi:HEAT repeat protein
MPLQGGEGVLIEECTCGNRMRVPASWAGQKKKCRRCGAVLILGSGVQPDESGISSGQRNELEGELQRLIAELIAAVEKDPDATSLTEKAASRTLSSLEKKMAIVNPLSRDEAIKRRAAIIELGKTGDSRAIPILANSLHDSWEAVRQGVATAAGELGDSAALPLALTLLMDSDAEVVRDAITGLRRIGDSRTVLILLMFGQQDAALKLQVREAIVGMGECVVSELIEIVQGKHRPIVRDAIVALGRIGDKRAVPTLLNALDVATGSHRTSTVEALGRIGDEKAVGPLVKLLEDPDEQVQICAAIALSRTPDARTVRPLMGILLQTNNDELRKQAVRALAATKDPRAVPAIARLLDSSDNSLKETIAEALGSIGDSSACQPLTRLLRSESPSVLLKGIGALRKVATEDAVESLIPLVQHPNPSIRRQTIEVLGDLRPPDAFDLFAELLSEDVSFEVRAAAARGLGKLQDKHAVRLLEEALRDEPTVRCAAVMGLTTIGDKNVIPALLATLKDATPVVRYHAVSGLGKLKAEQAIGAIQRLLEDKDSMVRTGAEKALIELGVSKPQLSMKRKLAIKAGQLMPNNLVGLVPGGVITIIAVPCAILAATLGFFVFSNVAPKGDLETAKILISTAEVLDVAWLPKSNAAAVFRNDGVVDIWNGDNGTHESRLTITRKDRLASVSSLNPSAYVFYRTGNKGKGQLALWSKLGAPNSLNDLKWASVPEKDVRSVIASADGQVALIAHSRTELLVWSLENQQITTTLEMENNRPIPVLSADGRFAAGIVRYAVENGESKKKEMESVLTVYSTESGEILAEIEEERFAGIQLLAFNTDGSQLAMTGKDGFAIATVKAEGAPVVSQPVKFGRMAGLYHVSDSTFAGIRGSDVHLIDADTGKTQTIAFSVSLVEGGKLTGTTDGSKMLIAASEQKSAWILDVTAGEATELSPLDVPEAARKSE